MKEWPLASIVLALVDADQDMRTVSDALEKYDLGDVPFSVIPRIDTEMLWSAYMKGSTIALQSINRTRAP